MQISDGEKLIILMLTEIYEKLQVDGEFDPEFIRSAIFHDETWGIPWKYSGIPFGEQGTPPLVNEVLDILDMWRLIEDSHKKLPPDGQALLMEKVHNFAVPPSFPGFDGNHEAEYVGTAHFIVDRLERFEEFKGRIPNTHSRIVDRYRKMIAELNTLRKTKNEYGLLSVDDIAKLLEHLSN